MLRLCYHIYNKCATLTKFTNSIFTNFDFYLLRKWEYQGKRSNKNTFETKLTKTKLAITNHNLDKSK